LDAAVDETDRPDAAANGKSWNQSHVRARSSTVLMDRVAVGGLPTLDRISFAANQSEV